jgi:hypothetical protein
MRKDETEKDNKSRNITHLLLNEQYNRNLGEYIDNHPGEWILIEKNKKEHFFKHKPDLEEFIDKKYGNTTGYTYLKEIIPSIKQNINIYF